MKSKEEPAETEVNETERIQINARWQEISSTDPIKSKQGDDSPDSYVQKDKHVLQPAGNPPVPSIKGSTDSSDPTTPSSISLTPSHMLYMEIQSLSQSSDQFSSSVSEKNKGLEPEMKSLLHGFNRGCVPIASKRLSN